MPGSHSVGSLFVNIGGSTKGLKKALGSAKKEIGSFSRGGGMFSGGRVGSAQAAMNRANERKRRLDKYSSTIQENRSKGGIAGMEDAAEFTKEMQRVMREQGAAKSELSSAVMARNMRVGFGILGVTVAGVSAALKMGIGAGRQSIQRHMQFGAIGPSGGRFVGAQIDQIMNQIRHAQSPEGSEILARQAERDTAWEEIGRKWEGVADTLGEVILLWSDYMTSLTTVSEIYSNPNKAVSDFGLRNYKRVAGLFGIGAG